MLEKAGLYADLVGHITVFIFEELSRLLRMTINRRRARLFGSTPSSDRTRNIVIVGASYAGYHAARVIAMSLPPQSDFRVVVIEPNSHFQFTFVLPRFSVVPGHDRKAFIPYGGYVAGAPEGCLRWVKDRVASITRESVTLQESGEEIPYEYLVIATGSKVKEGLPSRVNATEKAEGMELLQGLQKRIELAKTVVVVGGGAAGVEVATDAKSLYPDKKVVLVHSRGALMHRFGKGLQDAALEGMEKLGGEVILNDRVVEEDAAGGTVTLQSGKTIDCDCFINCTGQKPSSGLAASLSPSSISASGHIKVKPTLQIEDEDLPNVYICGDVSDVHVANPNARSAMRHATIAAENIVLQTKGKDPSWLYKPHWLDGYIELTLGLGVSTTYIGDGVKELMFDGRHKDDALMSAEAWKHMKAKAFEDPDYEAPGKV